MPVKIKTLYDNAEDIPDGFADLYQEKGGKFELVGVEGVKTQADIDRVNSALVKERADHRIVREKLQAFGDADPAALPALHEELAEAQAKLATLEAQGNDQMGKMQAQIDAAVNRAVCPINRDKVSLANQLEAAKKSVEEKEAAIIKLETDRQQENIRLQIRDAVIAAKVLPTAIDDAVVVGERMFEMVDGKLVTKADNGLTPGLDPKEWAKDMMEKRPHWWPASQGGGAQGGKGGNINTKDNPWSEEGWNLTKQGQMVRELGEEKAAQLAGRVGSKLGAIRPTKARSAA
jgi:hypothetical protein